jgi:hypothetical protein
MELAAIRVPTKLPVCDHRGTHIDIYRNIYIGTALEGPGQFSRSVN